MRDSLGRRCTMSRRAGESVRAKGKAMELPGGLGRIELGAIEATPVETAQGVLSVEALGYRARIARNGTKFESYWLRPRRVTLARPSGRVERAPVRDGAGRVSLVLLLSGVALTLGCLLLARK